MEEVPNEDKMSEGNLDYFSHVLRRLEEVSIHLNDAKQ